MKPEQGDRWFYAWFTATAIITLGCLGVIVWAVIQIVTWLTGSPR